jgi:histidyl-tRNA synthetase
MVKVIFQKVAAFNDLLHIVLGREDIKLDALVTKDFLQVWKPATAEEFDTFVHDLAAIEQLNGYSMCENTTVFHLRAVLYSLLVFIIQNRKVFGLQHAQHIVTILNGDYKNAQFDLTQPKELISILAKGLESSTYSAEQLKLFEAHIETVIFIGICLAHYLLLENSTFFLISTFGLSLDAIRSDDKFIDQIKHWNLDNKTVMDVLNKLENFHFGRTPGKTKSAPELTRFVLFVNTVNLDLKEIRDSLKPYLSIEVNHSTKSYFYESPLAELWRNVANNFHTLTNTLIGSYPLQLAILNELSKLSLTPEQKKDTDALISTFSFEPPKSNNPYHIIKANLDNIVKLMSLVKQICSLSVFSIQLKEHEELENPANKKKKLSFKHGKGTESFLTQVLGVDRSHVNKEAGPEGGSGKPQKPPAEAEAAPEEIAEKAPTKAAPTLQQFNFQLCSVAHREIIEELFESKNQERRIAKVPKGVVDTEPSQMRVKNLAFDKIKKIFNKHGAVEIDTPVFELKETLLGKYGEEGGKLIYDLEDQGGELLSLRYDLTVPFARYLSTHHLSKLKRYHIGKVYRRDQPDVAKGRFREFYQCDLDIAGDYDPMLADSECLTIIHDIMTQLDVGKHEIKLCHRVLLEGIVVLSGAPLAKFKAICSAIDKLDKEPWEDVKRELIDEKGIDPAAVEKIGLFVLKRGKIDDMIADFDKTELFKGHDGSIKAIEELKILSAYVKLMGSYDSITLDLSLARGLDYYTGVIYEVVIHGAKVGSVGAGGRYDNLVGMFGQKEIPCIGLSIGLERIFVLLKDKLAEANKEIRESETEFLIATIGKGMTNSKIELIGELWNAGIKAEMLYENNPKIQKHNDFATLAKIPFVIWIGESELNAGIVKVKV